MLGILKRTYAGHVGVEYMYISDPEQRAWIQDRIEGREVGFTANGKKAILKKLIEAESFERFIDFKYTGTKRFGLDGFFFFFFYGRRGWLGSEHLWPRCRIRAAEIMGRS